MLFQRLKLPYIGKVHSKFVLFVKPAALVIVWSCVTQKYVTWISGYCYMDTCTTYFVKVMTAFYVLVEKVRYLHHRHKTCPRTWCRCTPAAGGWAGRAAWASKNQMGERLVAFQLLYQHIWVLGFTHGYMQMTCIDPPLLFLHGLWQRFDHK